MIFVSETARNANGINVKFTLKILLQSVNVDGGEVVALENFNIGKRSGVPNILEIE